MMRRVLAGIAVALCAAVPVSAQELAGRPALPPDFDATMARTMADWSLPGLAVAVVRAKGETTLKTYGHRQWNRDLPVTEDTMFGIASITKTFVAAGVALLAQEGKLSYDDPVVKHLPEFRVLDPYVTQQVTIRDLLSHRSGIASHGDFFEELPDLDEDGAVRMLAEYGQSMPFRAGAQYSSYTYIVLDRIITKLAGKPWGDFLRERLWKPLGLNNTYAHSYDFIPMQNVLPTGDGWLDSMPTGLDAVGPNVDVAAPHVQWEAFFQRKVFYDPRQLDSRTVHYHRTVIDSGQGVFASIHDMAQWARVLLDGNGAGVLKPETIAEMVRLNSLESPDWPFGAKPPGPERVRDVGFGLGIAIYQRGGRLLYGHSGSELGFLSWMIVDPKAGFALVALTNNFGHTRGSISSIMESLLDWHYGQPRFDWSAHYMNMGERQHAEGRAQLERLLREQPGDRKSAMDARVLIGEYSSPLTGALWIKQREGGLLATTGRSYEIELRHLRRNIYFGNVVSALRTPVLVTFDVDAAGDVTGLQLEQAGEPEGSIHYRVR